jgi:hypothetical protein
MKKLPIFLGALVVIVAVVVLSLSPGKVYSANVGDQLTAPESGWTRYETSSASYSSFFTFSGNFYLSGHILFSGGETKYSQVANTSISFTFTGTKLRLIGCYDFNRSTAIVVTIDNYTYPSFSAYVAGGAGATIYQVLCFESDSLGSGQHHVTISNGLAAILEIDAVDIIGTLDDPTALTPSPTPVTTPTPAPAASPDLCYDYSIVGSLGTYNPGTIASNSQSTQAFTVTGTQLGDLVQVSFDQDLQGITLYGYVSAANQVTVVFQNRTGGNITLTSGNVRVHINRHVKG